MTRYASIVELEAAVGGPAQLSDWTTITQQQIDQFADATHDHQWIHVDPERAAAGPYGTTIAHGFLTLSLISALLEGMTTVDSSPMTLNYGLDKVRFLSPVPVNSRIRASVQLTGVMQAEQGARLNSTVTIEIDGNARPALVAESIALIIIAK